MTTFLHLANDKVAGRAWPDAFCRRVEELGELRIVERAGEMNEAEVADLYRQADVAITSWGSCPIPKALADAPGRLKYVCHLTGSMKSFVPAEVVEAGIPVTNWGDAPANKVAEGAMALLLSALKDIHAHVRTVREGGWRLDANATGGTLWRADVGVYGLGVIGLRFLEMLRPFGPTIRVYDPYASYVPPDCIVVSGLDELFEQSEIIVIHAAWTPETEGSVTAGLLAKLPRHGVVVNTARGAIIDQPALMAELESGRLRAGLDVTHPEPMPPDDPARQWTNCTLTAHQVESGWPDSRDRPAGMMEMHQVCLDNLRRFAVGRPLRFVMTPQRYLRST